MTADSSTTTDVMRLTACGSGTACELPVLAGPEGPRVIDIHVNQTFGLNQGNAL
jgi:hypothetical protein